MLLYYAGLKSCTFSVARVQKIPKRKDMTIGGRRNEPIDCEYAQNWEPLTICNIGSQARLTTTMTRIQRRPTTMTSRSDARRRKRFQMSMVKTVLELLKSDVKELMSADRRAAIMIPRTPVSSYPKIRCQRVYTADGSKQTS